MTDTAADESVAPADIRPPTATQELASGPVHTEAAGSPPLLAAASPLIIDSTPRLPQHPHQLLQCQYTI